MFLLNDVNELYNQFSEKVHEANVLDKKTKELIAVACSVMADCVPCIEWHYKQAVDAGATRDEVAEALAISMAISGGSKRAKFASVIGSLENKK
ncbi:MAG TPA: carboxymuconolactone decarboxylase family protein [Anaerolineales bacterium]|nr:carboxymuconolactone decarboxylase family protein [Anaerolineales bacterium]